MVSATRLHGSASPPWFALAASVALHALALSLIGGRTAPFVPQPVMVVTLRPEPPTVVIDRPPVEAPPPAPTPIPMPDPLAEQLKRPPPKEAPQPPVEVAKVAAASSDGAPRLKSRPGIPPELARELANRRLRVILSIDASGAVSEVDVSRNELTASAEAQLAQSLAQLRFEPRPKGTELKARLCFDESGAVYGEPAECRVFEGESRLGK